MIYVARQARFAVWWAYLIWAEYVDRINHAMSMLMTACDWVSQSHMKLAISNNHSINLTICL